MVLPILLLLGLGVFALSRRRSPIDNANKQLRIAAGEATKRFILAMVSREGDISVYSYFDTLNDARNTMQTLIPVAKAEGKDIVVVDRDVILAAGR